MQNGSKEYHQSLKAIIISYLAYRWVIAVLTYGILVVYDFLRYRNTKLTIFKDSITFSSGLFLAKSRRITYTDIQNFSVNQSFLGRHSNYGTVKIHLNDSSVLALKFTDKPKYVAKTLYEAARAAGAAVESAEDYELRQQEAQAQKLAGADAKKLEKYAESGKCPRCGSTNLQPVVEHAVWKGNGWSFTQRMCMNCSKKFH